MDPEAVAHGATPIYSASATHPLDAHNAAVDEKFSEQGACAHVHLPTGRMCTLRRGHAGSCEFVPADQANASLARHQDAEGWGPRATGLVALGGVLVAVGAVVGGLAAKRKG